MEGRDMHRFGDLTTRAAALIGLLALLILSAAILTDALSRSLFSAPIFGLSDLVELTAPVIVASCFPMALLNRQNITIRFLGRALPPRAGQSVELFGQVTVFVLICGIVWQLASYTAGLIEHNQFTWLLRVPIWPSWVLASLLVAACVPIQIAVLAEVFSDLRTGRSFKSAGDEMLEDEFRHDAE
jgi:TRAP-type C4-dicarboxylate transport system permease small subunit